MEVNHLMGERHVVRTSYDMASRSFLLAWTHKLDDVWHLNPFHKDNKLHHRGNHHNHHLPGHTPKSGSGDTPTLQSHGRRVTANLVPYHYTSFVFESDDQEDWTASVSMPWGEFVPRPHPHPIPHLTPPQPYPHPTLTLPSPLRNPTLTLPNPTLGDVLNSRVSLSRKFDM